MVSFSVSIGTEISINNWSVLKLPIGFLELALEEGRVKRMLHVPVAGEVLFEAGELAHPLLVCQKVGEVLEELGWVTHTLSWAQDIHVVKRLEQLEVCKGELIAAYVLLDLKVLDKGCKGGFCSVIVLHLIRILNRRHNDLINECVVDQRKHLIGPSLILRWCTTEKFWLPLGGNVL